MNLRLSQYIFLIVSFCTIFTVSSAHFISAKLSKTEIKKLKSLAAQELKLFDQELDRKGVEFSIWNSKAYPRLLAYRLLLENPPKNFSELSLLGIQNFISQKAKAIAAEFPTADEIAESKITNGSPKIYKKYGENIFGHELPANSNQWMLTFDDGPSLKYTQNVLDALKSKDLKANFFLVAKRAIAYKDLVHKEIQDGHMLANHSYTHADLLKASDSKLKYEITEASNVLRKTFGNHLFDFYRCPKGAGYKESRIQSYFKANKLVHVRWNVDSNDWVENETSKTIAARVLKQMKSQKQRGIILFHDIHGHTLKAVLTVIEKSPNAQWLRIDDVYEGISP